MWTTLLALLSSRKFWVGSLTVSAVVGSVVLEAMGKISSSALIPTITAITTTGLGVIGSIAWEDAAQKRFGGAGALPPVTRPKASPDPQPVSGIEVAKTDRPTDPPKASG